MATKDTMAERVEPTFLEGGLPESQPTIFVTRHTLGELIGENSVSAEGVGSSKESKDNF